MIRLRRSFIFFSPLFFCLAFSGLTPSTATLGAADGYRIVSFKVFPSEYQVYEDDIQLKPLRTSKEWRSYRLKNQKKVYLLLARGYQSFPLLIDPQKTKSVEIKLERLESKLQLLGEFPTGSQPKSVIFSPDGSYALVAQLSGAGFDLYQTEPFKFVREIDIPPRGNKSTGFVEFAFVPWNNEVWISQMTTAEVHIYSLDDFAYKGSIKTGGSWSKVILLDSASKLAFVSNWLSEDISVIDTEKKIVLRKLKCTGIPRGMAINHDTKILYAAIFSTGNIDKFDLSSFKRLASMKLGFGAKRHLLTSPSGDILYASDMELGQIWAISLPSEKILWKANVGPKLNTMGLSLDGKFIFVSSRGHNNPSNYLINGPDFGTSSVLDSANGQKTDWVWGRNQPTGLAVHPSKKWVAFTDFLDNNLELYDYSALYD